ncbi:hypothetical protein [Cupriavidus basilensis]|uniref:Uncharacterized protein n=1 Tax=Cupriavidus basilensis TaxID=68895 RepID=A0A643FSG0_9BURK|nr:hypothetical protein [Cupriavidus basilensis]QOT80674.1 hypothetical protein F7R26_024940 [Cupriavidus basilensis]
MLDSIEKDLAADAAMFASGEAWIEAHLTPAGWVYGSYKEEDAAPVLMPSPDESVLTVRRHYIVSGAAAPRRLSEIRTTRADSAREIIRLLEAYGEPHFNIRTRQVPRVPGVTF